MAILTNNCFDSWSFLKDRDFDLSLDLGININIANFHGACKARFLSLHLKKKL
jgi:hypothetical protein